MDVLTCLTRKTRMRQSQEDSDNGSSDMGRYALSSHIVIYIDAFRR